MQLLEACFADGVAAAEAHGAPLPAELEQADRTGEELRPLGPLDGHRGLRLSHDH